MLADMRVDMHWGCVAHREKAGHFKYRRDRHAVGDADIEVVLAVSECTAQRQALLYRVAPAAVLDACVQTCAWTCV